MTPAILALAYKTDYIVNHMVNNNSEQLNRVFSALADPSRRAILAQLAEAPLNPGQLLTPKKISKPALTKHLKILEASGLLRRQVKGRNHRLFFEPHPLKQAQAWIQHYQNFWQGQLDALDEYLEQSTPEGTEKKDTPGGPVSDGADDDS